MIRTWSQNWKQSNDVKSTRYLKLFQYNDSTNTMNWHPVLIQTKCWNSIQKLALIQWAIGLQIKEVAITDLDVTPIKDNPGSSFGTGFHKATDAFLGLFVDDRAQVCTWLGASGDFELHAPVLQALFPSLGIANKHGNTWWPCTSARRLQRQLPQAHSWLR